MIRRTALALFSLLNFIGFCQSDTLQEEFQFSVFTGTYMVADYQTSLCGSMSKDRHTVYAGLGYVWGIPILNERNIEEYRGNPPLVNPNRYGTLTYNSRVLSNFSIWLGYQYKLTKLDHRVKFFVEGNLSTYGAKWSKDNVLELGSIHNYVNINLGASMKVRFLKDFYYYANFGIGPILVFDKDVEANSRELYHYWDFGGTVLGVGYNF
jgi:hypothetical protein